MKSKVYDNAAAALDGVLFDGMTIAAGGFGLCGIPELLIAAIRDAGDQGHHHRLEQLPASTTSASACCCRPSRSGR